MDRHPLTKQRSRWRDLKLDDPVTVGKLTEALEGLGAMNVAIWHRGVGDGDLRAVVAEEPTGWHLSISHMKRTKGGQYVAARYPRWDEIADGRYALLPDDIDVVMHLPREEDYVTLHDTTFHLHEYPDREIVPQLPTGPQRLPSGLILPG